MEIDKKKKKIATNNPTNPTPSPDIGADIWSFITARSTTSWFILISLFAVLIRLAVALHPYSGANTPPMFGDFEAQRHWMELTVNLPVKEWYRNGTTNDLRYWGLDYPPLTAYQSYFHGVLLKLFDPASVAVFTSRGYETYLGKLLMRWTVLMSDLLIFFPAVLYFVTVYYSGKSTGDKSSIAWHATMILLNPCLILIDHGHFQFNCISLGLTTAAVAAILSSRDLVGSMLFSLALNHKQMSAYYAPAFFAYLLGKCFRRKNPMIEILKLGFVVLGTFALVWWPYLYSMDAFLEVLSRLAPFERGIYEDYVANFWCATSVVVKWKRLFTTQSLKLISLAATISHSIVFTLFLYLALTLSSVVPFTLFLVILVSLKRHELVLNGSKSLLCSYMTPVLFSIIKSLALFWMMCMNVTSPVRLVFLNFFFHNLNSEFYLF